MRILFVLLASVIMTPVAFTQSLKSEKQITPGQTKRQNPQLMKIQYGFPKWNKDSTKIDHASLFLRDSQTQRMVQIQLEETAPDSSLFSGSFSIAWDDSEQLKSEFYIPDQNLLSSAQGIQSIGKQIAEKSLLKRPFITRKDESGYQFIELFDTRDQATKAFEAYKKEDALRRLQKGVPAQVGAEQLTSKAAAQPTFSTPLSTLSLKEQADLAKQKAEGVRLEQIERQKRLEQQEALNRMAEKQIKERKDKAKVLAEKALVDYQNQNFPEAVQSFKQAVELNPMDSSYYYQYGVSLYKIKEYEKSLITLKLSQPGSELELERQYYIGLNQYRLKDLEAALGTFTSIKEKGHEQYSPSAAFYEGIIKTDIKRYDEALQSFQYVLDHSKDPALDQTAEAYIDNLIRLQEYEKQKAQRFIAAANLGVIYDSNVLLTANSVRDQGQAVGEAIRSLVQFQGGYKILQEDARQWDAKIQLVDITSYRTSLKTDHTLQKADPRLIQLNSTYAHNSKAFDKAYRFSVTPAFESIFMPIENNVGRKDLILLSSLLGISNTFVMGDDWSSAYNFDLRYDASQLKTDTGDNAASALRGKFSYLNYLILNKKNGDMLIPEMAYTINKAQGKNNEFYRVDLAVTYARPWIWAANWNARLAYFVSNFPGTGSATQTARTDQNYAISMGFQKPIWNKISWVNNLTHIMNNSNRTSNQYDKSSITSSMSYSY